ncbi:hypothetical protein N5938_33385 [Pseudomonas aeruginosa]|uniref:hypothetical protein n=1 Tax=Pseudomonas aeruginosa TaxID=287 RepID=UPI0021F2475A|nr:hypothetical protein [Pseudomonas aeruginosa]UYM61325.1 hypothetical protein N5938_33385 [Pseudomonas aeruginosa]
MSEIDLDEASLRDLVMVNDGQVVTTSLKVAERFRKAARQRPSGYRQLGLLGWFPSPQF